MGENRRSALRNPHYRGVLVYVMGEYRTLSPTTILIGNLAMGDNGGTAAEIYPLPQVLSLNILFPKLFTYRCKSGRIAYYIQVEYSWGIKTKYGLPVKRGKNHVQSTERR
jgi:hypothetical protein